MPKKKDILSDLEKSEEIKREIERISELYKDLEGNKKKVADGLIEEAGFIRKTLKDLKLIVLKDGPIDEMEQGSYSILREHPAMRTYNSTIQRYSSIIKQLTDLLPKENERIEDDGFDAFVFNRDD